MSCLFDDPGKPALFLGGVGEMGQGDLEKLGEGQMGRDGGKGVCDTDVLHGRRMNKN